MGLQYKGPNKMKIGQTPSLGDFKFWVGFGAGVSFSYHGTPTPTLTPICTPNTNNDTTLKLEVTQCTTSNHFPKRNAGLQMFE